MLTKNLRATGLDGCIFVVSTAPLSATHHLDVASGPETETLRIGKMALSVCMQQSLQFPGYMLGKDMGSQHPHRAFMALLGANLGRDRAGAEQGWAKEEKPGEGSGPTTLLEPEDSVSQCSYRISR